jgi:small-conductance mechanosensitive channel
MFSISGEHGPPLAERAAEILAKLERLEESGAAAYQAALQGDMERVEAALQDRQDTIDALDPALSALLQEGDGEPSDAVRSLLERISVAAMRVQEAEERLRGTLEHERARITRSLGRMDGQEAVRTAYGHGPGRPSQVSRLIR